MLVKSHLIHKVKCGHSLRSTLKYELISVKSVKISVKTIIGLLNRNSDSVLTSRTTEAVQVLRGERRRRVIGYCSSGGGVM